MTKFGEAIAHIGTMALFIILAGCGGGGGGNAGPVSPAPGPVTPPAGPPYIEGTIASFPILGIPPELLVLKANTYGDTVATVVVRDSTSQLPIADATVSVNGKPLAYVAANQQYEGTLLVASGDKVELSVTVGSANYRANGVQFGSYPALRSPVANVDWYADQDNVITWTGVPPSADARFAVGLLDGDRFAWPNKSGVKTLPAGAASSYIIPAGTLTNLRPYNVIAGAVSSHSIANAAPQSHFDIGGFTFAHIWVTKRSAAPLLSIELAPITALTVAKGRSLQLSATGVYGAGINKQDVTAQVTWSSSASNKVSIGPTGIATGLDYGSTTITARQGSVSATTTVTVFQQTPSPSPVVTQAVAYHIDPAHTGRAVFGTPLVFPESPTWTLTFAGNVSYPLIAEGKVFVIAETPGPNRPYGTSLYALDQQTGAVLWGPYEIENWAGHAYDQGKLFVVNGNGLLVSLNAATGAAGWTTQLPHEWRVVSAPTAYNGIVYISGTGIDGVLHAVDETSGKVLWNSNVYYGDKSSPVVTSDGVYVSYIAEAYKFDPVSGDQLWRRAGSYFGGGGRTASYFDGKLYVREPSSSAYILDATTGQPAGTFEASPIPAFASRSGYFLTNGTLRAVDLVSGRTAWTFEGDKGLVSAPIVIDQTVFVGSSSGKVFALDAATGVQKWSGNAGATILAPDEHNNFLLTGLAAGAGYLVVPAANVLSAWRLTPP